MDRKLIKLALLVLALSFQLSVFSKPVLAGWNCEPIYGGGERCWGTGELLIDKTVKNPDTGLFVDNLGVNDPKYTPGQEVLYRLEVKNVGSSEFSKVTVKDVFPSYLDFVWGPLGWDANTRTLQFDVYNLKAGESRQYEVMTRVFGKENLPSDRSLICTVNTGKVEADGKSDEDQAQICFEYKVLGITSLPPTGVENLWFLVAGLLVTTILGAKLALRKQA
ncbi:MAG: hypothetical protein BWY24_00419 [Microgenomates group bacterium ADurb.Bin219]|nr:MAG: hypothetical protein BWY24_00419 [Microgenomates group bacterium ADurb.Bin219]HNP89372.1 hypothetical protein [Candidatus Woesebacteria bacterium]